MYNVTRKDRADGRTPWGRRFGAKFRGGLYEFGSLVMFKPTKYSQHSKRMTSYGRQTVPAIFLGYVISKGGKWGGGYYVCPLDVFDQVSFRAESPYLISLIASHIVTARTIDAWSPVYFPFAQEWFSENYTIMGRINARIKQSNYENPYNETLDDVERDVQLYRQGDDG